MAALPRVSVIIVTWNAKELLQKCLPSVVATNYDNLEIVVADNHSTDGSAEWVRKTYPDQVKVVRHPENWAFCKGNNAAVPHTTGEYVVLLNNDVEVPPHWLTPLVEHMEAFPTVGAVQPKLLQYDDREMFEYAGGAGGYLDRYGYPFTRGRIFNHMERDDGQYDEVCPVFWASGAAIMLRRRVLEKVGLLDEAFVLHMEEIDLCWRMARHGYRVETVPTSEVYHLGGSSLPRSDARKTYYNFRNSLLMLYKNLPPQEWRRILPGRLLLDLMALLFMLFQGQGQQAQAILRAYRDAFRMHAPYKQQRPAASERPVLPSYRGSIVIDYFLRGRRSFQELPSDRFRDHFSSSSSAQALQP